MSELNQCSVKTLSQLIRGRELTVSELLDSFICEIERVNPKINALIHTDFRAARQAAFAADQKLKDSNFVPGELFGIPFTAKDLYAVPNHIVTFGTKGLMNTLCHQETTVISRLIQQGSIFLGLTNTPELGLSLETDNLVYGRTNHPMKPNYSSGGSSGGEAALIASHASPMGLAGDHGGGARYPAHCCGVYTLRPSLGRLPQTGCVVPKRGWVALTSRIAPMTNCIDDLDILFHAIQGGDGLDPYAERHVSSKKMNFAKNMRIVYLVDQNCSDLDPAMPIAFAAICKQFAADGMQIDTIETKLFEEGIGIATQLFQADAGEGLNNLLQTLGTKEVSHQVQAWLNQLPESPMTLDQYLKLWAKWDEYKIKFLQLFQTYDVLLCPVSPQCALPHGETLKPNAIWPLIRYTASITLTECPVVVIPCGTNQQQFPIGMQVVTRPWEDELALAVAKYCSSWK
ncbi:amidase [Legionella steelei]|uniref:Amidase n=2 Tax=Legionella steelei TaxID=947033 RepID=A0A0W0ZDT8_9GAMM|nr:amidase [Legionella steelei]KTD67225.1 amidase [Legionella steelei]